MGYHIAVFRHRQQFIAATGAGFCTGHLTGEVGETLNVQADGIQHDINRFQELLTVQIFQNGKVNT